MKIMKFEEFMKLALQSPINIDKIEAFEKFYGVKIAEEAEGYFCALDEGVFLIVENNRFAHVLDSDTILFSEELISSDFAVKNLLPLVDLGDGDYICYIGNNNRWGCYSVTDRVVYCVEQTLSDVFRALSLIL